ncbi:MAG: UPF0280 family protein [Thermodesulfobacteriota bacterium]|nr:UPF0280 family protein [Thermodesulfobacteriota bacterium]
MTLYRERTYRKKANAGDLVSFHVAVRETDLWVSADRNLEKDTIDLILDCRYQLETYIRSHSVFLTSLKPLHEDHCAPPIAKEMIDATKELDVGPMASVAGAVAQYVGKGLLQFTDQVIVENGGDIFLKTRRPATVSVLAGSSPLSGKFGLLIPVKQMPSGVCASSATVGHSLSTGIADVVCLVSSSAALADGAATALGNRIKIKADLERVGLWADNIEGIRGGLVIAEDRMAAWGDIELVEL